MILVFFYNFLKNKLKILTHTERLKHFSVVDLEWNLLNDCKHFPYLKTFLMSKSHMVTIMENALNSVPCVK